MEVSTAASRSPPVEFGGPSHRPRRSRRLLGNGVEGGEALPRRPGPTVVKAHEQSPGKE